MKFADDCNGGHRSHQSGQQLSKTIDKMREQLSTIKVLTKYLNILFNDNESFVVFVRSDQLEGFLGECRLDVNGFLLGTNCIVIEMI